MEKEEALAIDESCCSTPYVSAPSSPTRNTTSGFYYSAPASPMHFLLSTNATLNNNHHPSSSSNTDTSSFDFNFTSTVGSSSASASADELFINGQIRPTIIKLSPLLESNDQNQNQTHRGRELKSRIGSLRRRTRSESPSLKNNNLESQNDAVLSETTSRSSRRWIFLKELLLYRSKSEGRKDESGSSTSNRFFWNTVPVKEKEKKKTASFNDQNVVNKKSGNSNNKRGKRRSAHEVHYAVKRAEAEEMRKKTFLPYKQGLLGCLGFSSKSYGAVNGFARALNPVSSR